LRPTFAGVYAIALVKAADFAFALYSTVRDNGSNINAGIVETNDLVRPGDRQQANWFQKLAKMVH
jgi:hypothetical protein